MIDTVRKQFENLGGQFLSNPAAIMSRYKRLQAIIFDWDGVFNDGIKSKGKGTAFSEPDSMGLNMLRFDMWQTRREMPAFYILSGENNETAIEFARREHFNGVYLKSANKRETIGLIVREMQRTGVEVNREGNGDRMGERDGQIEKGPDQMEEAEPVQAMEKMAFVFDDINDLKAAAACGMAFFIRRAANPMLEQYVKQNQVADYITASPGGQYALREIAELLLGLNGTYDPTITHRIDFDPTYKEYLARKKAIKTKVTLVNPK